MISSSSQTRIEPFLAIENRDYLFGKVKIIDVRCRESETVRKSQEFHIGCQSWQYDDWVTQAGGETIFYPRGTRPPDMLSIYAEIFNTIEVDSTAYGTPALSTLNGWMEATPDGFLFSLKVPRDRKSTRLNSSH